MCYCDPCVKTPCCGDKCHAALGIKAEQCAWHKMSEKEAQDILLGRPSEVVFAERIMKALKKGGDAKMSIWKGSGELRVPVGSTALIVISKDE